MNKNTVWHQQTVTRKRREALNGHRSAVLWFTGLSGAGKSTLANAVEDELHRLGCRTYVFDGDNIRHGLCKDLAFSEQDRTENIRRIGEVAKLCLDAGLIVLTAFISPFRKDRQWVRSIIPEGDFIEVYCHCPIEVCEDRDVKGLYRRARAGEIPNFTGISSPYEEPEHAEVIVETSEHGVAECARQVVAYMSENGMLDGIDHDRSRLRAL